MPCDCEEMIEWAKTVVKLQTSPAAEPWLGLSCTSSALKAELEHTRAFRSYAQDESPVQHQASAKNVEALRQALMQA